MNKTLVETCLESVSLRDCINYYAWKLSIVRKNTYDIEDAKQDLWEALLVGLQKYDGSSALISFAKAVVYSRYGKRVDKKTHLAENRYEYAIRDDMHDVASTYDEYSHIDIKLTLDNIESRLEAEANKGRQYRLALSSLKLRRVGFSQSETAHMLGITQPYMRNIMKRVRPMMAEVGAA